MRTMMIFQTFSSNYQVMVIFYVLERVNTNRVGVLTGDLQ